MREFFEIIIAFFSVVGFYYTVVSIMRRVGGKYKDRVRGTFIYIPSPDAEMQSDIVPFSELIKRERLIVVVRSDRERDDVINDLIEEYDVIYKYEFM